MSHTHTHHINDIIPDTNCYIPFRRWKYTASQQRKKKPNSQKQKRCNVRSSEGTKTALEWKEVKPHQRSNARTCSEYVHWTRRHQNNVKNINYLRDKIFQLNIYQEEKLLCVQQASHIMNTVTFHLSFLLSVPNHSFYPFRSLSLFLSLFLITLFFYSILHITNWGKLNKRKQQLRRKKKHTTRRLIWQAAA